VGPSRPSGQKSVSSLVKQEPRNRPAEAAASVPGKQLPRLSGISHGIGVLKGPTALYYSGVRPVPVTGGSQRREFSDHSFVGIENVGLSFPMTILLFFSDHHILSGDRHRRSLSIVELEFEGTMSYATSFDLAPFRSCIHRVIGQQKVTSRSVISGENGTHEDTNILLKLFDSVPIGTR
jgi:hypothetical protein